MGIDFAIRPSGGGYRGVLLDWRGTLVVAPTDRWLVRTALRSIGRDGSSSEADEVLKLLRAADSTAVDSSAIDTDPALHRAAFFSWFAEAGLDGPLSEALYAVESDVALNPFANDVGRLLRALRRAGVRVGILSDIHVDLRPAFARHHNADGSTWADLVDAWVLSFELGVAKPNPKIFAIALERLGLPAHEVLMVGDRGAWDGAAAEAGITTLILPPLRAVDEERLNRVLDLAIPGHGPWVSNDGTLGRIRP
ncbi:MAG: HAD family hydrolase [Pseudonocardiaceae bacterium]